MNKYIVFFLVVAYLFINEILPRISALSYEAKDVTLVLQGCDSEECYLRGTWKRNPVTLNHILVKKDGTQIIFKIAEVKMLSVPSQQQVEG